MVRLDHITIPVMELARSTEWYTGNLGMKVEFEIMERKTVALQDDADLTLFLVETEEPSVMPSCTLTLLGFWWSHIPSRDIPGFLVSLHERLEKGAHVVILDNHFVAGSSTPVYRTDSRGNTYQLRKLSDGSRFQILKNFPDAAKMQELLSGYANAFSYRTNNYYWLVHYEAAL